MRFWTQSSTEIFRGLRNQYFIYGYTNCKWYRVVLDDYPNCRAEVMSSVDFGICYELSQTKWIEVFLDSEVTIEHRGIFLL